MGLEENKISDFMKGWVRVCVSNTWQGLVNYFLNDQLIPKS